MMAIRRFIGLEAVRGYILKESAHRIVRAIRVVHLLPEALEVAPNG
jgi:hypothetical protein